jgi:hypothetical protein
MGNYLLDVIMAAIMVLPFVLMGGLIAEFLHSRHSK